MAAFAQWNNHIRDFRQSLEHIHERDIAETLENIQLRLLNIKQIPDSETEKDVRRLMGRTLELCTSISETLNGTLSTHNHKVAQLSKGDEGQISAVPSFDFKVRKELYVRPLEVYHEKLDMVCDTLELVCIVQK
jgi:hypothetical protein